MSNPDRVKTWQWHEILNDWWRHRHSRPTVGAIALCRDTEAVDLTEVKYLLYEGDWSAGWTGEKLFSFDRREEFGQT
jgi:hypothetical protein